ncbi:PX-domain-containing protein [Meira miltonrushii]|uniref:Sorting nexin MVP1 n=1 Tax=Meira miltonrushii TaxID=1280837 RepID=A0A316VFY6_9BASI|nr:PX-domain-containing protein [Meira miltonrushii]PWN36492.1 PX-domain-containing protein [Meira miltonrushii]
MTTQADSYSVDDPWSTNSPIRNSGSGINSTNSRPLTWAAPPSQTSSSIGSIEHQQHLHHNLPELYEKVFELSQSAEQSEDQGISLGQLGKIVRCAQGIQASDVERIINLSCSSTSSHCSKEEYATALLLIAQLQSGSPLDINLAKSTLASAAREDGSPIPTPQLDLGKLRSSAFMSRSSTLTDVTTKKGAKMSITSSGSSNLDPWAANTSPREGFPANSSAFRSSTLRAWDEEGEAKTSNGKQQTGARPKSPLYSPAYINPDPSSVHLLPDLGGFLFFRHVLYLVKTPICAGVKRRYSDFVNLHEYLLTRFPFRLLPPLPPKRLSLPHMNRTQSVGAGQQDAFLEQRRLALARYTRGIMSHPVMRKDGVVQSFFGSTTHRSERHSAELPADENASTWKGVTLDGDQIVEEGLDDSWRLSDADVMHIPVDMEDKLKRTKELTTSVLDRWNGVVAVFERQVRRTEASSAEYTRLSLALSSLLEIEDQTYQGADETEDDGDRTGGGGTSTPPAMPLRSDAFQRSSTLLVSNSQDYADLSTARFHALQHTLDALKNGRDLWVSLKDLFKRYDKFGKDPIPDLESKIESLRKRWKSVQEEKKPGWQEQCGKIKKEIEREQKMIERFKRRNERVKVAIWHEMARAQELKNHIIRDWQMYARNESIHLAALKQAAEELNIALDQH